MKKISIKAATAVFLVSLTVASNAFALDEIIRNYRGIRSLGMGGVVTTTGLYDEALFANPATAALNDNWKIQILSLTAEANTNLISDMDAISDVRSASGNDVLVKISDKKLAGKNEHARVTAMLGAYSPKLFGENTGFSFALLINSQNNIMLRSTAEVEMMAYQDVGPAIGIHHRMLDGKLALGVNLRGIYRVSVDQTVLASDFLNGKKLSLTSLGGQGFGVDGDVGAYYTLPFAIPFFKGISVGGSLNNLVQSSYRVAGQEAIKSFKGTIVGNSRTAALGVRADLPDAWFMTNNLFSVEFQNMGSTKKLATFWKKLHMGGETKLTRVFSFRGGVNQGYPTAGFGINLPVLKIDLATYSEELGPTTGSLEDRRYAVKVGFEI